MKSTRFALVLGLLLTPALHAASSAMDGDGTPVPAAPVPQEESGAAARKPEPKADATEKPAPDAAAVAASDKKAREILAHAAERQNAGDLAEAGRLESFHVVFHSARFEREKTNEKGEPMTPDTVDTDVDGLVVDWKQGSIKTQLTVDGNTITKAWYDPRKAGWVYDGTKVSSLLGADRRADYDQLQFHRKIIDQLVDVAILAKMVNDKSRWRVLDDSAPYEKTVAIQRLPTAEAPETVQIVLWVENPAEGEYGDIVAASMPPTERGGATLYYRFAYDEKYPEMRRNGPNGLEPAKMRFPKGVGVYEQRPDETTPREVLRVITRSVDINSVKDEDFRQPRASR
jgi:hypothetical protein